MQKQEQQQQQQQHLPLPLGCPEARGPSAGLRLKSSSLQTLLYLCSGGDDWHLHVAPPTATPTAASCASLDPTFLEGFPEFVELRASNPPDQEPAEPMQASDDGTVGATAAQAVPLETPMIVTLGQEAAPLQVWMETQGLALLRSGP